MKTIRELHLTNFQIHRSRKFKFTDGLNIFIGDNNVGKSSVVRAIIWALTNAPAGDWMRSFDDEANNGERLTTSVRIVFDDGVNLVRIKGDKENKYIFDEHEFTKVGRSGVPDPIAEYIGNLSLPMNKNLMPCLGGQDEMPFMVFESGPTKAGLLNYLTGVDLGDKMRKECNKEARAITRENNLREKRIKDIEEELESYEGLEERGKQIKALSKKFGQYEKVVAKLSLAQVTAEKHQLTVESVNKLDPSIKAMAGVAGKIAVCMQYEQVVEAYEAYCKLRYKVGGLAALETSYDSLLAKWRQYDKVWRQVRDIEDTVSELKHVTEDKQEHENLIKKIEAELSKIPTCPTCGNVI